MLLRIVLGFAAAIIQKFNGNSNYRTAYIQNVNRQYTREFS